MPIVDFNDIQFDSDKRQIQNPSYDDKGPYDDLIVRAAEEYQVDPFSVRAFIKAESNFNPDAIGPETRYGTAKGLTQMLDGTAKEMGVTNSLDPIQSVMGGTQYYAKMLKKFKGNKRKAHAAYNAGARNIQKAQNRFGDTWFENLHEITGKHADETRNYVRKIEGFYNEYNKSPVEVQKIKEETGKFIDIENIIFDNEEPLEFGDISDTLDVADMSMTVFNPDQKVVDADIDDRGAMAAFKSGLEQSIPGLMFHGELPAPYSPNGRIERLAQAAGALVPELPVFIAGAIAGSSGGPIGSAAGAFALPAAIRHLLVEKYSKGEIKSTKEFLNRFKGTLKESGKGYIVGAATGTIGGVVGGLLKLPAEIGTMVTVSSALEGELPEMEDFETAALLIGALKIAQITPRKLKNIYKKHGKKPLNIAEDVKNNTLDIEIAKDLGLNKKQVDKVTKEFTIKPVELNADEITILNGINKFRTEKNLEPIEEHQILKYKERSIAKKKSEGLKKVKTFRKEKGLPELENLKQIKKEVIADKPLEVEGKKITVEDFKGTKDKKPLLQRKKFSILTAENPNNVQLSKIANIKLNLQLEKYLKEKDIKYTKAKGQYDGKPENPLVIFDLTHNEALEIAKKFNQESIVTDKGLLYQDGTYNPIKNKINFDPKLKDNFTTINIEGKPVKFALDFNWDKKVMRIVRYGKTVERKIVKPKHMGKGQVGAERSQFININTGELYPEYLPKSPWYVPKDLKGIEAHRFGMGHVFEAFVEKEKLFDWSKAKKKLTDIEIRDKGYKGYYDPKTGQVRLFEDQPVTYLGKSNVTRKDFNKVTGGTFEKFIEKPAKEKVKALSLAEKGKRAAELINKKSPDLINYNGIQEIMVEGKLTDASMFTTTKKFGGLEKGQTFVVKGEPTTAKVKQAIIRKAHQFKVEPGVFGDLTEKKVLIGDILKAKQARKILTTIEKSARISKEIKRLEDARGRLQAKGDLKAAESFQKRIKKLSEEITEIEKPLKAKSTVKKKSFFRSKLSEETGAVGRDISDVRKFMKELALEDSTVEQAKLLQKKKYASSINMNKQEISIAAKKVENQLFKTQDKEVSVTNKEQIAKAEKILAKWQDNPKEWVKATDRIKKGKTPLVEEELAHRILNADNFEMFIEMAKAVDKGEITKVQFDNFQSAMKLQAVEITDPLASAAGQRLQMYNVEVGKYRASEAIQKLKTEMNDRQFKAFTEVNWDDPIAVKAFIRELPNPKSMDYVYEFWYNSILSGIPTHLVNTISTGIWTAVQVPHKALVASLEKLMTPFGLKQRTAYLNEIGPMLSGYAKGAKRGLSSAKEVLIKGNITEFETKWAQEIGSAMNAWQRSPIKLMRQAAPFISIPTRGLRAMDLYFNAIAFDGEIASFARRLSNAKGLKGVERMKFETDFRLKPSKEALTSAYKLAKYSTFMDDPGFFSQAIIKMRSKTPGGRFVVPFVNTVGNLLKRGIEMTPGIGLTLAKGQSPAAVLAKQIEGAIIVYALLDKFTEGKIILDTPKDPGKRKAFYRQGKIPWSIEHNGKYYAYRRIEPFNTVIATTGILYDKLKQSKDKLNEKSITDLFTETVVEIKNNFIDSAYLQGVSQLFFNRWQNSNQNQVKAFVHNLGGSFVPYSSFFRSAARSYEALVEGDITLKEKKRKDAQWYDPFLMRLPSMPKKFPSRLNVWGKDIKLQGGMFRQWLPYKMSTTTSDPVEKGLEQLNIYPNLPQKKVKINKKTITLDDDIYRDFVLQAGNNTYKYYNKLMQRTLYQKLIKRAQKNESLKINLIQNLRAIYNRFKDDARKIALNKQRLRNKHR